jgi:ribosome maturation protein SDO1
MVTVEKAIIARIKKGGKQFEVLVDSDMAYDLKSGKIVSLQRMLAVNHVYTDSKKGDQAGPSDLQKIFGTSDVEKIAEEIVKHGEIQLTTDYKRKKVEEKRKQIIAFIARNAMDPRSKLPHPPERIQNAMEQARVQIDAFRSAEQQVDDVLKAIRSILPISIEEVSLIAEIPAQYTANIQRVMREYGAFTEQWLGNSMIIKITIPAGLKEKFYNHVNHITEGNAKITERK